MTHLKEMLVWIPWYSSWSARNSLHYFLQFCEFRSFYSTVLEGSSLLDCYVECRGLIPHI